MDIGYFVIDRDTTEAEVEAAMAEFQTLFSQVKQVAFVVCKGALEYDG